jgi:hypothetical protein
MTKAERLEYLRKRLGRSPQLAKVTPKPKEPPRMHPFNAFGPLWDYKQMPKKWISEADEACRPAQIKPHRTIRKSPLVKIAEHYFTPLRRR